MLTLTLLWGCNNSEQNTSAKEVTVNKAPQQRSINFNKGWSFRLIEESDTVNYSAADIKEDNWRQVNLPHDWSIKVPFSQEFNGATAYLPGGLGWYRKTFTSRSELSGKKVQLYFDGVYANAQVFINGTKVGERINGYSPFFVDLTKHLNPEGEENIVAVKVDHTNYIDSRWYTGSGIYRDVNLVVTDKLHIPIWGNFVTTPSVSKEKALVNAQVSVNNEHNSDKSLVVRSSITDQSGQLVAQQEKTVSLKANAKTVIEQTLDVTQPKLWDIDSPNLYVLTNTLVVDGNPIDSTTTKFGIRDFLFDKDKGFFLNGRNLKIKGVNLHHDAGLVGTAVPDDVWRRRLLALKDAGVNAIRTAHNPVSINFLDLCDELGLLVQAEIFDEWDNPKDKRLNQWERHSDDISRGYAEHFQEEAERDLKDSMLRDRNHPSIFMWSIGNEIEWTYPRYKAATGYFDMNAAGNYFYNPPFISPEEIYERFHTSEEGKYVLAETAKKLSKWVKEIDTSRPITANLILPSVSHISGYTDALDVIGYSYRRVIYDYGHELFPDKPIMGNENVVQWHEWKAIEERDFISGTFLWTGIDYLGEAHNAWPRKATPSGMLDTAGFKKPSYYMFKSLWQEEPVLYITSQTEEKSLYKSVQTDNSLIVEEKEPGKWQQRVWFWQDVNSHWNYQESEMVIVEVLTNCENVDLLLNGDSLGSKRLSDNPDRIIKWALPYTQGELKAVGCGKQYLVNSASKPVSAHIRVDKNAMEPSFNDVAHIELQLIDENGHAVSHAEEQILFSPSENIELLGVDNGDTSAMDSYNSNTLTTAKGKALAIVRAKDSSEGFVNVYLAGKKIQRISFNQ
ncbi:protein of unknown function [Thalassotalea agarivorans]|uniref:Beta-galactosidase n=2 Tax=Thalassotalea agarivorans TaxID=349064 RepID=A0A1I0AL40_THASX|nr:protein of unknown function [Thalassotalea agarivorans]